MREPEEVTHLVAFKELLDAKYAPAVAAYNDFKESNDQKKFNESILSVLARKAKSPSLEKAVGERPISTSPSSGSIRRTGPESEAGAVIGVELENPRSSTHTELRRALDGTYLPPTTSVQDSNGSFYEDTLSGAFVNLCIDHCTFLVCYS